MVARPLVRLIVLLGPFALFPVLELPYALPLAIFFTTAIFWLFELLPLPATALMVPILATTSGVLTIGQAFSPFGSEILFLFLGCFLIAQSIEKHGLDRRIAFTILASRLGASSPGGLVAAVASVCFLLSMWISNTATCAMMVPVCLGIIRVFEQQLKDQSARQRFTTRLLIACAFGSSIGGMATPVGSPPNLLAIQFLKQHGVEVSFIEWMQFGLPLALIAQCGLLLLLAWRYPLPQKISDKTIAFLKQQRRELGALTTAQIQTAAVFLLAIALWVLPDLLLLAGSTEYSELVKTRLPMSTVALGAGLLLFFLRVRVDGSSGTNLVWEDAVKVDWGTIMLFGGGLALSAVLERSGLAQFVGESIFSLNISLFGLIAIMILLSIVLSEFSSNTASAAIVIPILLAALATPAFSALDPRPFVIAVALGASFGFMLPVSTPPNAIIFGTGRISVRDLIGAGVFFDLLGAAAVLVLLYLKLG